MTSDSSIVLAIITLVTTITTAVFASQTWTQKELVKSLRLQIEAGERREKERVAEAILRENERVASAEKRADTLLNDQRASSEIIHKLVVAIEKLTDEQARGTQLLGDLVYGRDTQQRRG